MAPRASNLVYLALALLIGAVVGFVVCGQFIDQTEREKERLYRQTLRDAEEGIRRVLTPFSESSDALDQLSRR